MDRNFDIPMPRLLGIKVKCQIAGREKEITLKVVECDVPLPIVSSVGEPMISGIFYTTQGELAIEAKKIPQPDLALGALKPWVVEDILYDALGRDKPKEELNPEILGPVGRKLSKMGGDDEEEKKSA